MTEARSFAELEERAAKARIYLPHVEIHVDGRIYRRPASELWDIIARADAKFCDAAKRADEAVRYDRAVEYQREAGVRK